jgi:hypothetical protein
VAAGCLITLAALGGSACAQPDVLWLGVQERDDMPQRAVAALDSAIRAELERAAAPKLRVLAATRQSPETGRALRELDFTRLPTGEALGDTAARALGIVLDAKATVRAWAEIVRDKARLTTFSAAVHRRQAVIDQVDVPSPPQSASGLTAWARDLARRIGAKIAPSLGELTAGAPTDAAGYAAIGEALIKTAPGMAALEYGRAIAAAPKEASYYLGAARSYVAAGAPERASRELQIAVRLEPSLVAARVELGRAELLAGDAINAVRELQTAIEQGAGDDARMVLAAAFVRTGNLASAGEQYRAVAAHDPNNTEAAKRLADIAAQLGSAGEPRLAAPARGAASSASGGAAPASGGPEDETALVARLAAAGNSDELIRQLPSLAKGEAGSVKLDARQYVRVARAMDRELEAIMNQARSDFNAFRAGTINKEEAVAAMRGLHGRSDVLARASGAIAPPVALERGHAHRGLGYSLLNQSDFSLLRYLERGQDSDYDDAVIARRGATTELRRAWDLDAAAGWPTRTAAES